MKINHLENPSQKFDLQFMIDKPFDVVGFGTNSVDHLCVVPEYPRIGGKTGILRYETLTGGQVATAMLFLARMGLKSKYIGKVGGDELGGFCLRSFEAEAVDTAAVLVEKDVDNQCAVIIIDKQSGERTVLSRRDGGLDFRESELLKGDVVAGRILHLDGYDCAGSLKAAAWCRDAGIPVCIDLDTVTDNCRDLLRYVDFLIVSSNFPSEFTGIADVSDALKELRHHCDGFLAVTLGAEGAMALLENRCVRFPGLKVNPVDTTGAGDIFHAAFIYGLLQNWTLGEIMNFANASAGLSCRSLGAQAGIPAMAEIMEHAARLIR